MTEKDRLFMGGAADPGSFAFDEKVVPVFSDMISRSVPGYELVVPLAGLLARRYARDGTRIYDLGCSLGAVTLAMQAAVSCDNVRFVAIDNSAAMVERCREIVAAAAVDKSVEVVQADVMDCDIRNASVVALNFTLQFIDRGHRLELLERIARGLCPGGALLLSEKIRSDDAAEQELLSAWHEDFKRARGYSDLEIAAKRSALENVLQPDTPEEHLRRLEQAGFTRVTPWFRCFNFISLIAFR